MDRRLNEMVSSGGDLRDWTSLKYIIVDEAQFCTGLIEFIDLVTERFKIDLILVGLLTDADRKPFVTCTGRPEFLEALCYADHVEMLSALCSHCKDGTPAIFTLRKQAEGIPTTEDSQIFVGAADIYEAVCRQH